MTAYYNENEPYAAEWLRNLIREGLIADGHVDARSIEEVSPSDLADYRQCHFFAGIGGWSGALRLAGVPDGYPLWTGSCPCQPFSLAGAQKGFDDARHLWPVWQRLIAQCRPAVVLGEQVASAARWLGLVRGDLEALDYAVGVMPVEAASAGAYHLRDRYWFVGHLGIADREGWQSGKQTAPTMGHGRPAVAASGVVADRERGAGDRRPDQPFGQAQGRVAADRNGAGVVADAIGARLAQRTCNRGIQRQTLGSSQRQDVADARPAFGMADAARQRQHRGEDPGRPSGRRGAEDSGAEWVVGADGKARRVEPGIRLLAHGVPQRVAKLRALGNAIDLRPAAAFIRAAL